MLEYYISTSFTNEIISFFELYLNKLNCYRILNINKNISFIICLNEENTKYSLILSSILSSNKNIEDNNVNNSPKVNKEEKERENIKEDIKYNKHIHLVSPLWVISSIICQSLQPFVSYSIYLLSYLLYNLILLFYLGILYNITK